MNKQKNNRIISVISMGCRVNQLETELLRHGGGERGFRVAQVGEESELIIVNTCSVTNESDRAARQLIRRAGRENPQAKIVVTGCYAQQTPEILAALPQVALVLGNQEKSALWQHVDAILTDPPQSDPGMDEVCNASVIVGDISTFTTVPDRPIVDTFADRSRAYLQLQDGCDRACTYCLIPGVRGPSRSLHPDQILAQAQRFVLAGFQELVLTGIDLGSFGRDLSPAVSLADMIEQLVQIPHLGRIRLSSIDPADIDEELLSLLAREKKICSYLHLSIQSGDSMILKRMGRRTDQVRLLEQIRQIKTSRPEIVLGADLIVGFPTESEEAFENSLRLVNEAPLVFLHIFRYSDRPGTPAAQIPQRFRVEGNTAKNRSERLRQAGVDNLRLLAEDWLGRQEGVLIESVEAGLASGKISSFLSVNFNTIDGDEVGQIIPVRLTAFDPSSGQFTGLRL
ncbi:MAG: tRNA (N(6)-L-threonylcarbamoyladenosine(37)-C(2))-methylthiotransferase MtaB [Magnetococcales bacterium]|nr:tRNA (N(6)-L-threonylcarbamoyladenosine(37)-C(2))-methylthiotransferase MtaB [Magnetococcales bacterium]